MKKKVRVVEPETDRRTESESLGSIEVNGESFRLERPLVVAELLERLNPRGRAVAVEINREILTRGEFPATTLRSGDRVEIVTLTGGG